MSTVLDRLFVNTYLLLYSGHKLLEPSRANYTRQPGRSNTSAVLLELDADWLNASSNASAMSGAAGHINDDDCGLVQHYSLVRFVLLQIASVVGIIGIVFNNCLLWVFIVRQRANLYQIALAALDMLLCLCYVCLFGVDAFSVYLSNEFAFRLWHLYGLGMFFVSRTVQMAIPHVMICATFERLVWIVDSKNKCLRAAVRDHWRYTITAGVFVYALAVRWPMLFAYQIKSYPNCTDVLGSLEVFPRELYFTPVYRFYDIYVPMILQVCLPFVLLLTLNLTIIIKLHMTRERNNLRELMKRHATMGLVNQHQLTEKRRADRGVSVVLRERELQIEKNLAAKRAHKRKVRDAIYTMSVIVASYLLCNGMNVLMIVMEKFIRPSFFFVDKRGQTDLYVGITDMISFLYMFFSSTRLIVYLVCNPQTRFHLKQLMPAAIRGRQQLSRFANHSYWRRKPNRRNAHAPAVSSTIEDSSAHSAVLNGCTLEQQQPMLLHNKNSNGFR